MSKSFKECAVEIAKEAAWAGFVVAATTAVELTLSEIRNNSQDDDDDEDDDKFLPSQRTEHGDLPYWAEVRVRVTIRFRIAKQYTERLSTLPPSLLLNLGI